MANQTQESSWQDYEGLVNLLAKRYCAQLPEHSEYKSLEVMRQEGRISVLKALRTYYGQKRCGVKLITYVWNCVEQRFKNILRRERRRPQFILASDDEQSFPKNYRTPEQDLLLAEVIFGLAQVSKEFVSLIVEGAPTELLAKFRRHSRALFYKRTKRVSGIPLRIKVTKKILEEYFGRETMRKLRNEYFEFL